MGFQDFISESEALSITGMSATTLMRFAEAGYLQVEADPDGLRMFSRTEVTGLFGTKGGKRSFTSPAATPIQVAASTAAEVPPAPVVEAPVSAPAPVQDVSPVEAAPMQSNEIPQAVTVEAAADAAALNTKITHLEQEMSRMLHLADLQERMLDLKDAEIQDLKKQRDWLQLRVEKLEDKSDRDQLLLLTETQTIRTLLAVNQRRSPMRLALEWLGFADAPQGGAASGNTFEVNRTAAAHS